MTPTRLIDATAVRDNWWLIRIAWQAPLPQPGQWLWLEIDDHRFCLPVRDADATEGWLAGVVPGVCLNTTPGPGTLAKVSALRGEAVTPAHQDDWLLLGEDLGIGPALALAERYPGQTRLVLLGGRHGMPARLAPSRFFIPALADVAIAGIPHLEQLGVPARIALADERPGVYEGQVMELLGRYLGDMPPSERQSLRLVAFGPWGTLEQQRHGLEASVGSAQLIELP